MKKYSGFCVGGELAGQWIDSDISYIEAAKSEPLPCVAYEDGSAVCNEIAYEVERYTLREISVGDINVDIWALEYMSNVDILRELLDNYKPAEI